VRSVTVPPWPSRVAWHNGPVVLSAAPGQALLSWVAPDRLDQAPALTRLTNVSNPSGLASGRGFDLPLLVHQKPRSHLPATQVSQGWVFTNALSLLDSAFDPPEGRAWAASSALLDD